MNRADKAVEIKHTGVNCAQAVLLAYEDISGLDEDTLRKLGTPFGMGMGTTEGTCGALCGAQMILGLIGKGRSARLLTNAFKAECGALQCGDIKGVKTGKMLCSCDDCVANAARILEGML